MHFFELLGPTKALLPRDRNRKIETSEEMTYAEIKAYRDIGAKGLYNGESAAKPSLDISHRGNGRNVQRLSNYQPIVLWRSISLR